MASRAGIKLGQRVADKLTAKRVQDAIPPKAGHRYVGDGKGLYLRVSASGARSWAFRYRVNGKLREMGLGSASLDGDGVPLFEARERAQALRRELRDYRDGLADQHPLAAKAAAKVARRVEAAKAITFRECAEQYITAHRTGWRNAQHAKQWPDTLAAYVYPLLGDLPVQSIDMALVLRVLQPIWTDKPVTASRVRGRIESVLNWATTGGHRTGDNPARWRGHLEHRLPKPSKVRAVEHHAALPYREMAEFMTELRQQDGVAARALEFTILTAARAGEVQGARWSEINLAERVWTVPASRMKGGKEHRVPLSDAALTAVGQPRSGLVFPGLTRVAMLRLLVRMGREATVHGFRSAFSDWCTEQTQFPTEVREMALAHTVGTAVERAYRRSDLFDKRRQLAEAWARYCEGGSGEVVALRTGRGGA